MVAPPKVVGVKVILTQQGFIFLYRFYKIEYEINLLVNYQRRKVT